MAKFLPFPVAALWGPTDEQSMARVKSRNDEAAFARLVRRWEAPVRRLCTRMTGDEYQGQDLAQEAFARVYLHRHSYRTGNRFSTWLWRIALNLCHDEIRRRRRRPADTVGSIDDLELLLGEAAESGAPPPDETAQHQEQSRQVRAALQQLPDLYRVVLVLRHYEGLKFREIAEVLEIPEGTVKSRMTEALNRLAQLLEIDPGVALRATTTTPDPSPCVV